MTTHGFKDASTNPIVIKFWWMRLPRANIGIATGWASGIVVLDVDAPVGPISLQKKLHDENNALDTLTSQTGGSCDGRHYYFSHPGGSIPSIVGILPGLDIRGDRSCINAPPSNHISGRKYQWLNDAPLAKIPDWIYSAIHEKEKENKSAKLEWKRARRWGLKSGKIDLTNVKDIVDSERGNNLISILGQLKAEGMDRTTAVKILTQINKEKCKPPYPEREFQRLIRGFFRRYNKHHT
jgi:putative DNA primase/helicase